MAKFRRDKINEEYRAALASVIRELKDPRIPVMTSVVTVSVTPDQKFARANISVMGDAQQVKDAMKALNAAKGFVRREVASRIKMRLAPEITFVLDGSIEYGAHIAKLLKEVEERDAENGADA